MLDVIGIVLKTIVTFGFGGAMLAGLAISIIALPLALLEMDYEVVLTVAVVILLTTTVYYYFRVASFILWKLRRRGCREASFDSVLVDGPHYEEFYLLHVRLNELTAKYEHLLSEGEIAKAAGLARRHRIAAWTSGLTFVSLLVVTAILAAFGVLQPSGG